MIDSFNAGRSCGLICWITQFILAAAFKFVCIMIKLYYLYIYGAVSKILFMIENYTFMHHDHQISTATIDKGASEKYNAIILI